MAFNKEAIIVAVCWILLVADQLVMLGDLLR